MHRRVLPPEDLLQLARTRGGVVTRAEAAAAGVGRHSLARLVREGFWQPLGRGAFLVEGRLRWSTWAWAGLVLGGEGSLLGGRAAGFLHELVEAPPVIDVWVPTGPVPTTGGRWRFRRDSRDRVRDDRHPATGVADTVLDLASELGATAMVDVVFAAVRRSEPERIRDALTARRAVRHRALLGDVLAEVAEGVESPLESAYRRRVEAAHGLPAATRQHRSRGTRRDVVYEEFGVVVELDGAAWHRNRQLRDMRRDNINQVKGEVTLRYGWQDTTGRPCEVAAQVAEALHGRGWTADVRRCRDCVRFPDLAA